MKGNSSDRQPGTTSIALVDLDEAAIADRST